MKLAWLIFSVLLLNSACSRKPVAAHIPMFSQEMFLTRQITLGSEQIGYRVFIPKEQKAGEKLPVMLFLHGSDERGDDNDSQLSGPAPTITANPNNFKFIIVFPQCPAGRFWDKEMIERAIAELDQTVKEFDGDESRLYLAGFSLGGYGAWTTAAMYPNKFAAVVPMSGRLLPRPGERKYVAPEILELADAENPFTAFAQKLKDTPIWIFHGAKDNIVPVENSRRMAKALKEAGNENSKYTELENTGHLTLIAAIDNLELFEWLVRHQLARKA